MCRFLAYIGKKEATLGDIIAKPENSLISQSRSAREGLHVLNADGFGVGWYNQKTGPEPGVFKSVQPAWNNQNLKHLVDKVQSTCFLAHVRASTVGYVNTFNCHPFQYKNYSFVHNGTIHGFDVIRRSLLGSLGMDYFSNIKGQTDSEYFFSLVMNILHQTPPPHSINQMASALSEAIHEIDRLRKVLNDKNYSVLNLVLTDGKKMVVSRYLSDLSLEPFSLYYMLGKPSDSGSSRLFVPSDTDTQAVVVASERLTECVERWEEVPVNHLLLIDEDLKVSTRSID